MNELKLRLEMGERITKFKIRTKVISWTIAQEKENLKGEIQITKERVKLSN